MKNVKLEGVTRGDKLCKSRGGEKFWGDTGEDPEPPTPQVIEF